MPVVLRVRGYRIWFYSADLAEPPHVHVGKAGNEAKYWIAPVRLARNRGFKPPELSEIQSILLAHQNDLLGIWQDTQDMLDD